MILRHPTPGTTAPGPATRPHPMRASFLLALFPLAACAAPAPAGRYLGTLTPKVPSAACPASRASVVVRDKAVVFTPDEGTWTLRGAVAPDGTIAAERAGRGADRSPYVTRLSARLTPERVTGEYVTPRCTFALTAAPG